MLDVWREPLCELIGSEVQVDHSVELPVRLPAARLMPTALVAPRVPAAGDSRVQRPHARRGPAADGDRLRAAGRHPRLSAGRRPGALRGGLPRTPRPTTRAPSPSASTTRRRRSSASSSSATRSRAAHARPRLTFRRDAPAQSLASITGVVFVVFLVISALLARIFSADSAQRAAIIAVVQDRGRGDTNAVISTDPGMRRQRRVPRARRLNAAALKAPDRSR